MLKKVLSLTVILGLIISMGSGVNHASAATASKSLSGTKYGTLTGKMVGANAGYPLGKEYSYEVSTTSKAPLLCFSSEIQVNSTGKKVGTPASDSVSNSKLLRYYVDVSHWGNNGYYNTKIAVFGCHEFQGAGSADRAVYTNMAF